MNIAFFLLPKDDVIYMSPTATVRQALERMEYHRYSAVPLVDENGKYVGTITEGDLLWELKNHHNMNFESIEKMQLKDVPLRLRHQAVSIYSDMRDLIALATVQNFVPVVDDRDKFIGIVRRREIIEYCAKLLEKLPEQSHPLGADHE